MSHRKFWAKVQVLHYKLGEIGNLAIWKMLIPNQNTVTALEHKHLEVNNPYQKESLFAL